MMKLVVVIGSIRPGRITDRVAKWVANEASKMDGVEVELVDLIDYPMPLFNEVGSPQYNPNRKPELIVKKFLDKLETADAVALVTPEYNRSYSSIIKNALDYIAFELKRKPVLLVAHGSTGGAQAVAHLRGVLPGLQAVTEPVAVMVIGAHALFDENGGLDADVSSQAMGPHTTLDTALTDLKWYSDALAAARK